MVIFEGLKFVLFRRGYNFKISMGVNFRGCCISCIFEVEICI